MSLSLEKSVRTCSVNTGEANRIQSDRFFNPNVMVCPVWNGINNKGQEVAPDSQVTKTAGCNSAEDRVLVENALRPQYSNYVTLGAQGIAGHIYGSEDAVRDTASRDKFIRSRRQGEGGTGNFGIDFGAKVNYQGCSVGAYERNQAMMAQSLRNQNFLQNGYMANSYRGQAGM